MNLRLSLPSVSAYVLAVACSQGAALAQEALPPIDIGNAKPAQSASTSESEAGGAASATGVQNTTAGPVRGYEALTSISATKTDTPIRELPLTVQVIPRKLIDDQGAVTQSEAFRNVSDLQPLSPLFPGQSGPMLRGMPAERFVDGLPNYYDYGARDLLANVERIEVLKGPSSILYQGGPNPIGGIVNIVSKLPTPDRFAEVGVKAGGYQYASPYIDINQPLTKDGTVLFRFTGQYETTHAYIEA